MDYRVLPPARTYADGIGQAVADRTVNRLIKEGDKERRETWAEVAQRVAEGNASLVDPGVLNVGEYDALHHHLRRASIIMSGRHLQHGDDNQYTRNMEVFTNCSTAASTYLLFYLLLNGSGVGRSYSDDMMAVDWREMPIVVTAINPAHPDIQTGEIIALSPEEARHLYAERIITEFKVPDSREGWAQAIEIMEMMTFAKQRDDVLLLDFSDVRERGRPIGGMQNRPASGPGALMKAIEKLAKLRDAGMEPWRSAMYADHYVAECVLVGGARRAARLSAKIWTDPTVLDFIDVKMGGFLWSSNNSVLVDDMFWRLNTPGSRVSPWEERFRDHAVAVFNAVVDAAYLHGTGEPGFINVDKLVTNSTGMSMYHAPKWAESARYKPLPGTNELMADLAKRAIASPYAMIVNPCGEVALFLLGGYCVVGDNVPYHTESDEEAVDSFKVHTRALMRVNLMDSLYNGEVKRTNRIGVSITGLHEYALKRFGYGFRDIIDEAKSKDFWMMVAAFARAVHEESLAYAVELGMVWPHTSRTVKPSGTTAKLFGLTEGVHLPARREYLRWVQFRYDDPLVETYAAMGYPTKKLRTYSGTVIVGFPTKPEIVSLSERLGLEDKIVTASEATPFEQYEYLRLLEKYWIRGVDEKGVPLADDRGNQVSYTLKYDPTKVSLEDFRTIILEQQSTVRACSMMPSVDAGETAYEYLPEQPISKAEYETILQSIIRSDVVAEDVDFSHIDCSSGACPIDFNKENVSASEPV